jgi:hypothetical protein
MAGFSLGFGLFLDARDPNRYMLDEARRGADYVVLEQGMAELVLHYIPAISLDFAPFPWLRLQSLSEIAWGPKVVSIYGPRAQTRLFEFVRFSEIGLVNLELGVNERKTAQAFFGVGIGVHHLDFEEHSATAPGYRAQLGFGLLQNTVRVDGVVAVDYVRARSGHEHTWLSGETGSFTLDYTSIHLDAIIRYNAVPR